jgi:uridine kinase
MPRVVGVVGGSGAGKSSLTAAVLGKADAVAMSMDSYYRDLSHLEPEARAATDFDSPAAVDLDLLAEDLAKLKEGRTVRPPLYDMFTHTRIGAGAAITPAPLVLVEGTLLLSAPRVAAALDLVVYVDTDDDVRLERRIDRDVRDRGRTEASVRAQWRATVLPMHRRFVLPARDLADLVVSGTEPPLRSAGRLLALL